MVPQNKIKLVFSLFFLIIIIFFYVVTPVLFYTINTSYVLTLVLYYSVLLRMDYPKYIEYF